jgi:phosphoribulokinase
MGDPETPRPVILGVVGDSATGKTTITRGLVRLLGEENVTHIGTDDYHRYDRKQRAERGITPLDPECNYIDVMTQDLHHVRRGEPILKPVYGHSGGSFGPPEYVVPRRFAVVEGLLGYSTPDLLDTYDVRVYLAPPEDLRRKWKVSRDVSRRGYTTDQVLEELDMREPDSAAYIRPQERKADLVVSFKPAEDGDDSGPLNAEITLREGLSQPDLSVMVEEGDQGITLVQEDGEARLWIPGDIDSEQADAIEAAMWEKMHFASHLRTERLGEYTVGTDLHRSNSLAVVQVLLLYHLVTAKAAVALGGEGARADNGRDDEPEAEEQDGEEQDGEEQDGEEAEDE